MIKINIKIEDGLIHSLDLRRGDDFLSTLDKFLKKNTMGDISTNMSIFIDCGDSEDSISCRIAKISLEAIKLIKGQNLK
jgi:hypothetical protein